MASGGSWSAYWYNGVIVSSEIARGLDIFELTPSAFISQNEIDAAKIGALRLPEHAGSAEVRLAARRFALARAYVDQLERSKGLDEGHISSARKALAGAEKASDTKRQDELSALASELDGEAKSASDPTKVQAAAGAVRGLASEKTAMR